MIAFGRRMYSMETEGMADDVFFPVYPRLKICSETRFSAYSRIFFSRKELFDIARESIHAIPSARFLRRQQCNPLLNPVRSRQITHSKT